MKNMFIKSLLMLCAALLCFVANGANEKVYSTLWRTADITPGNSFSFEDARYATMSTEASGSPSHPDRLFNAFYNKRVTNRIILKIDQQNKLFQPVGYAFNVKLRITTQVYNGGSSFTSQVHEKNMLISYNPSNVYNDQSVYEFNDDNAPSQLAGYHMQVEVLQVSALPGNANIQLYAEIETERYFTFNFNALYSAYNYISPSAITSTLTSDNLHISWTPSPWAEQYDLEWFHVSNLDQGTPLAANQIPYNENSFRFDATRVTVTGNSFQIPLVYNQGYIVFRIRGYGKTGVDNYNTLIPGYWSTDNSCTGSCTNLSHLSSSCYKLIDAAHAHEEKLNWQYGLSFAEEGKHKVSVSYFDGTFRGRQTVIKSNIFNRVIVAEKIYDHEGRPAIDVLPAPSPESKISYKRSFNVNASNKAYSRLDFDLDHSTCDADEAAAMSSTKGSARYYSPNNDLADGLDAGNDYLRQFKKYIPDAEGFPFQQTIFTPDNTGDIKIKTGVGKTLMEGTGKTTRTFYGKPFQEELDRLFGTEVGNALSYNKNMVIDPNGQVSISYLNPAGKVIATNLAGNDLGGIVEPVRQTPISTTPDFRVDLLNKPAFSSPIRGSENIFDFATRSLKMNRTILVDKEQPFYFSYENQGVRASFNCSIPTIKTFCYDCVFDLKISLTDECGNEYLSGINATVPTSTQTVIGQSLLTDITSATPTYNSLTRCSTNTSNIPSLAKNNNATGPGLTWVTNNGTSTVPLKVGSYQLKKELVLNEKVLDYYTNDYIQRNTGCIKDITYFRNQFAFINEIYDCDMSCEECIDRLGEFGDYSGLSRLPNNPELTQEQYDKLLAECNSRCEVKSKRCDALYQTMLADMSPNGQYGEVYERKLMDGGYIYGLTANNAIKPYLYPLSVFNEGNYLPVKENFGTRKPNWRHPYTEHGEEHYYTEKGEIDLVPLTPVDAGYLPAVADPSHVQIINGLPYVEPHKLLYVEDFLRLFKPSWTKSLVMYHPEYPLYLLCGEYNNSHDFDELWLTTNSYESAQGLFGASSSYGIFAGELNPVGKDWNGGTPIGVIDPYFDPQFNANITQVEYEQMMYDMVHFVEKGSNSYSIWEVAYHLANYPNSNLLNCHPSSTFSFNPNSPYELTTGDREKFWQIFRGLYQSLKQRQQQHHFARMSIANSQYDAYNGCIGNNYFNATKYGFLKFPICSVPAYLWSSLSPWFAPFWWSQYFNFSQPCNWARAYLYRNKMARFQTSTDGMGYPAFDDVLAYDPDEGETFVLGQTNEERVHKQAQNNANISMFNQCDKCPIANQLEALLNKLTEGNIKEFRNLWNCNNAPNDNFNMIDEVLKDAFGASEENIAWIPEISENTLTGYIGECSINLVIPNGAYHEADFIRFDNMIGLYNLKYIHNPTLVAGTNNTFEITAYFNAHKPSDPSFNPANTKQVVIQGVVSCLDIANCDLKPTCVSSSTANELLNLFNSLLVEPDASKNSCSPTWPTITPNFINATGVMLSNPPYQAGLTPSLKYEFDRAISPAYVNVNEAWYWTGNVDNSNLKKMTGVISASAISGNHGSCRITFEITSTTALNMTHVKRFAFISPDPENQPFGFIAKALASDGSTTEYITIKGTSSCFAMGKCSNGPLSSQDINNYTPTSVNCADFAGEAELLARLNCGEFSRFTSGGNPGSEGYIDVLPRESDGTETCLCFKASNPATPLNLSQLALDLNTLVNSALTSNPCVAAGQYCVLDSITLTLYDNDWERVYGVPQPTSNHIYFKVDWTCFNDDTFYYDASGNIHYISRYPDFKDVYIYKRCKKEKDGYINLCQSFFQMETDVVKGLCLLKLVNNCSDCNFEQGSPFNKTTIICSCPFATSGWEIPGSGGGGWSGTGGSWGYSADNCPPLPCAMQLEFPPVPGFSIENIVGFKSIKPDPDRPVPAGYFVAVVRTNTGAFMTIKGFMPCLKKAACGTCDASDITPAKYGTFPPVADDLPVITSDYGDVTTGGYSPVSTMPQDNYMLVTNISGDPVLHDLDNHTGDPGSRFMLLKGKNEGGTVRKIWEHTYTVEKNVPYEFTFYYANPLKNSLGVINQVLLTLNGNDATGRTVDVEVSPIWHKVTYQFRSDVATAVLAVNWIENMAENFIAIDDISLNKVCGCQDVNLVENGNLDFNNITSSFTTDFKLDKTPKLPTVIGDYIHVSEVTLPSGVVVKDQLTPGSGNFMLALVRANSGPMVFWQTTAKVQPGKEYVFDARWLASYEDAIDMRLKVNGVVIQKISNAKHLNKWLTIRGRWINTSATVATIVVEIENINSLDCYAGLDEVKFIEMCNPGVCPLPVFFKPVASNCTNIINGIIEVNAANAYNIYLEDEKRKFKEELINKCLNVYESFEMKYIQTEHLYTLYYYDQANNLVRTVPPSGVKPLTDSLGDLAQVKLDRINKQRSVFTSHDYATTYKYNSLGGILEQSMPDQDNFNVNEFYTSYGANTSNSLSRTRSSAFFAEEDGIAVGQSWSNATQGTIHAGINATATLNPLEWGDVTSVVTQGTGTALTGVYAVTKQRQLLYSTDGDNWFTRTTPSGEELVEVLTIAGNVHIYAKDGKVWSTNNNGDTWTTEASICTNCEIKDVHVAKGSGSGDYLAIALATDNRLFYKNQASTNWTVSNAPALTALQTLAVQPGTSSNTLLATGNNGNIYQSGNDGDTWSKKLTNANVIADFSAMAFATSNNGMALSGNNLYTTTDGGITWTLYSSSPTISSPRAIQKFGNEVYIVNAAGSIFKMNNAGAVSAVQTLSYTNINTLSVIAADEFVIGGNGGFLRYETTGSGTSFDYPSTMGITANVKAIQFSSSTNGVVLTTTGLLYHVTPDPSATSFIATQKATAKTYTGVYFTEATKGYAFTASGHIMAINLSASPSLWVEQTKTGATNVTAYWAEHANANSAMVAVSNTGDIYTSTSFVANWVNTTNTVTLPPLKTVEVLYTGGTNPYTTVASGEHGLVLRSINQGANWSQQTVDVKHTVEKTILGVTSGTVEAYAFLNTGTGTLTLRGTSAATFTTMTTNPVPSGVVVKAAAMRTFTGSDKKAVVAVLSGSNKQIYQLDLLNPAGYTHLTSTLTAVTGTYTGIAAHTLTSGSYFTYAVGPKAITPQNDHSGVLNTNLSICAYHSAGSPVVKYVSTAKFNVLNDVAIAPNSTFSCAVGNGGIVLVSTNKGVTWQVRNAKTTADLRAVSFYDAQNGVAVGNNVISVTRNGGETWTSFAPSSTASLRDVTILDEMFAVAVGDNQTVYMVNGAGFSSSASWVNKSTDVSAGTSLTGIDLLSVSFAGKRNGVIATSTNKVVKYTINPATPSANPWSASGAISGLTAGTARQVTMPDLVKAFLITYDGKIFKSISAGASWTALSGVPSGKQFTSISSPNNSVFYLLSEETGGSPTQGRWVRYRTEDHYGSRFYYDRLGRMVFSQNSKQYNKSTTNQKYYSYTFYDAKGRTVEAGEIELPLVLEQASYLSTAIYANNVVNYNQAEAWIRSLAAGKRTQVVRTFYDIASDPVLSPFTHLPAGFVMRNLRSRVAHITYAEVNSTALNQYDFGTHYTYDAHGNVNSILHENNMLPAPFNTTNAARYKRINYEYDLISDKVNMVTYQAPLNPGDAASPDRYFHKYEYDAENKLTHVYTSADGIIWQQDAKYLYYMHGPLARTEIGNDQVQGVDYAYTLQGWIKGVNSGSLNDARDIGKDGNLGDEGDLNRNFAYDEYGYTLGYYHGDYKDIGGMGVTQHFEIRNTAGGFYSNIRGLYNGNISSMVTAIRQFMQGTDQPQARAFVYDQLNRLRSANVYNVANATTTNSWRGSAAVNNYQETFAYDLNGNITTLTRKDEAGNAMDNLTYRYATVANGYAKNSNRLRAVQDAISTASNTSDIESGQVYGGGAAPATDNYQYDELGNLTKDAAESITNITWTLTGKIKAITFSAASGKDNLEFYYDPAGNRTMKVAKPQGVTDPALFKYTVYARDAQGNIMSTYKITAGDNYRQESAVIYGSARLGDFIPNYYTANNCGLTLPPNFDYKDIEKIKRHMIQVILQSMGTTDTKLAENIVNSFWTEFETRNGLSIDRLDRSSVEAIMAMWARIYCNIHCYFINEESARYLSDQHANFVMRILEVVSQLTGNYGQPIITGDKLPNNVWTEIQATAERQYIERIHAELLAKGFANDCGLQYAKGSRRYELSNHLGNVLAVVSDRKKAIQSGTTDMPLSDSRFTHTTDGWNKLVATTASVSLSSGTLRVAVPASGDGVSKQLPVELGSYNFNFLFTLTKVNTANIQVVIEDGAGSTMASGSYSSGGTYSLTFNGSGFSGNWVNIKVYQNGAPANANAYFTLDNALLTRQGVAFTEHYEADLLQATDYYAFGSPQPSRIWEKDANFGYRFGFGGKENDNEVKGEGNSLDYGARIYDPRLGRWLSLDPLMMYYPDVSAYVYCFNNPFLYKDPDGRKPKVTILPESFAHKVGQSIKNIHDFGETSWTPVLKTVNNKVIVESFTIRHVLNFAFIDKPSSTMNPDAPLNKENPGLYRAVSMHERVHSEHFKAILEDDNQKYAYGDKYKGTISEVIGQFETDFKSKIAAADKKIGKMSFKSNKERNAYVASETAKLQKEYLDFYKSVYKQVSDKMNAKYGGNEENATVTETAQRLMQSGDREAAAYQINKSAKYKGKVVPLN